MSPQNLFYSTCFFMRKKGLLALLLFLLSLSYGCLLQNEDENFVEVKQEADPRNLAGLEYTYYNNGTYYPMKDTFWLAPLDEIYFVFKGTGFRDHKAEVDGKVVSQQSRSTFSLRGSNYSNGVHTLNITQYVKSGTGSLADKADAEVAAYSASFVLIVGAMSFTPVIKSISLKDGSVQLTWNAYNRGDFHSYEIRKYESYSGPYDTFRKLIVTSPSQTVFKDTTYAGGWVNYVLLVNRGGKYFQSADYRIQFPYKPDLKLTSLGGGRSRLSWQRPPFYNNVRSVQVSMSKNNSLVKVLDNLSSETTSVDLDFNWPFGDLAQFSLMMKAKVDTYNKPFDRFSVSESLTHGKRVPPVTDVVYNPSEDAYHLVFAKEYYNEYPAGIYRLDGNLNITDTLAFEARPSEYINLLTSPDGSRLYVLHALSVFELNKNPVSIKGSSYHTGTYFTSQQNAAASNNGFILYQQNNTTKVLDFVNKKVLISVTSQTASHLSADGQYFVNGSNLYLFDGTNFNLSASLPYSNIMFLRFLPTPGKLLIATTQQLIVYDYVNQASSASYNFATTQTSYPDFNDHTLKYYIKNMNALTSIDITNGTTENHVVYQQHWCSLAGKHLFTNSGFGLKLY